MPRKYPDPDALKNIHNWLRDMIQNHTEKHGGISIEKVYASGSHYYPKADIDSAIQDLIDIDLLFWDGNLLKWSQDVRFDWKPAIMRFGSPGAPATTALHNWDL